VNKEIKNVAASVLAKLRNHAKASGVPLQQVLQHYAIERFLYRISKSAHAQSVVLKGALLLKTIDIPSARPTMDIDMLRQGRADEASLRALVRDCMLLEVEPDGLAFLADSLVAETITKDSEYQGTRLLLDARMDNVRLRIQIDFGVGDVMVPGPRLIEYPAVLEGDTIQLLAIPSNRRSPRAPGDGIARRCQQPDEGLLRCLDMLKASGLRPGHPARCHRCHL